MAQDINCFLVFKSSVDSKMMGMSCLLAEFESGLRKFSHDYNIKLLTELTLLLDLDLIELELFEVYTDRLATLRETL